MDKVLPNRTAVCCHCGTTIAPGEPRWAGDLHDRLWHYRCAEQAGLATPLVRRRRTPAAVSLND